MKIRVMLMHFVKLIIILAVCTMLSIVFHQLGGVREENILMLYLTGVVLVIITTRNFWWGLLASVASVLGFNFFFTAPYLTLRVNDKNYFISFAIFFVVCGFVGSLTTQLQRRLRESNENEMQSRHLYEMSSGYLNISGRDDIARHTLRSLHLLIPNECMLYLSSNGVLAPPYYLPEYVTEEQVPEEEDHAWFCYEHVLTCGHGTTQFPESTWKYIPVKTGTRTLGVLGIRCSKTAVTERQRMLVNTVVSQMALALERELLANEKESTRVEIEKEKLRNNLLRSISHDLRTPLTGIAGSASFLIDSFDSLEKPTVLNFLGDIVTDSVWLNNLVENLLNMTRIQDGRLTIKKEKEVVDDIISEAYNRIVKMKGGRVIDVSMPEELLLVPMDGKLIIGVLVNLLDNACKHTRDESEIRLAVYRDGDFACFEVSDNGGGVPPAMLEHIFESFVGSQTDKSDSHRGIGLGLSICKSIVEAHDGMISVFNNERGGATFRFDLPLDIEMEAQTNDQLR